MAITTNGTILETAAALPTTYTPPTLPTITEDENGEYTVDIAISEADPATPATGIANVIAAVEAHFLATYAPSIGLDATATIVANLTLRTVQRVNTSGVEDGNIFIDGTEVFRTFVNYTYSVA